MAPMADGLSESEKLSIARYLGSTEAPKRAEDIDPKHIWGAGVEGSPLDAPPCAARSAPVDPEASGRWNGWSVKPDNARFQPDPGLAARDVPRLKLKWALHYAGAKNGQATVVGRHLFVTSMSGALYALDARTGCVEWRHAAAAATRSSVTVIRVPTGGGGTRSALFFSDWTKSAVALDADTGEQIWKTVIDDQPGVQMTGAPTVWENKVFVPISSGNEAFASSDSWECCRFRGAVVAIDAATGRILWKRYTNDVEPHVFKINRAGRPMWGPSGGAIWSAPTIDAARRLLYVGTSNAYTELPYENADAVMAIEIDTGQVRWSRQLMAKDTYIDGCWPRKDRPLPANCPSALGDDFEIGASPILKDGPRGQMLLVGQKSGVVYALDPARKGATLWERRLSPGGALGGIEFGMAADERRLYVGISDVVTGPSGKPGLYALDIADGALLWSAPNVVRPECRWRNHWCHGAISQAVSAIPGMVFAGSYDGHFRAYDAGTGKVAWDFDTGSTPIRVLDGGDAHGGVMDGAGPTIANGMVYVHTGYAGRSTAAAGRDLRNTGGNLLLAFSVDGR
jgi:polyvinyl alcohol dehydrogenase (cytochrome)